MKNQTKKVTRKGFRPQIRSRHPSHDHLRTSLNRLPFRSVVRFGSTTEISDGLQRVEVNTVDSIRNSSDKLRMKRCFHEAGVSTAMWWTTTDGVTFTTASNENQSINELSFPIVAKNRFGSRGMGNTLIKNVEELNTWLRNKTLSNYIFEKYYNYVREYRIHVSRLGCFYSCRKMIKQDTPEDQRWYKNDNNSVWILPSNELFDQPINWYNIQQEAIKALNATGLDVGAVDLRVQSRLDSKERVRENPEFIIIEINSAPGLGDLGKELYIEHINDLIRFKNEK